MRGRFFVMLAFVSLLAAPAMAQTTGEIFGKVTDQSGGVLPGVTVTVSGPTLLQPLVATTSETGTYQFPRLAIGKYSVKFELTGFKTFVREDVEITVGFNAQINAQLNVSAVQETVTVTGESPVVDTRQTGTRQTFTNEALQSIPSARDPWVILQQTAGIAMDRENVGGNQSGQQSNYVSRGGNPTNNKWMLDGVDITDMAATGASPYYYDFDAFQEMTINTGGVDVTQQTGGVGINLVTKSGTDKFHGSGRVYNTNDRFGSNNITDDMRKQGATSGNPVQDVQDYGFEMGGPIKRGRAWVWGSFGKQDIDVGVINFYQPTPQCQQLASEVRANPLSHSIEEVNDCLNSDTTLLQNTNLKAEVQLFNGNKVSFFNNFSKKVRNARNASDLNPIETTVRQKAVPSTFGTFGWRTGPSPTYKIGDQWVLSDRLLVDVQYAHVGNNFILDFHEDELTSVQPILIVGSGLNLRSAAQSVNIRPVNSVTFNSNYFLPGTLGGDHAFKFGGYWRDSLSEGVGHTGGNATVRYPTQAAYDSNACVSAAAGCGVTLTRDSHPISRLTNVSAFVQDTLTMGKSTFQLGLRYDRIHDQALASAIPANPILPNLLPAQQFAGGDPGVIFNNLSPRVGFTYDLAGNGRTIARVNAARYYGQVGNGAVSGDLNLAGAVTVRYPWTDLNGDRVAQANEIFPLNGDFANFQNITGNWDPRNPTALTTANKIDPNLKNDTTDEVIVGASREIGRGFAVDANYIWRRYGNFSQSFTNGVSSADYINTTYQPTCTVAGARCEPVVAWYPTFQPANITTLKNTPNFDRTFNGFELSARKRMENRWMLNTSFSYNSTIQNYGPGSFVNPNNIDKRNGYQYDYSTAGSGIGNVFVNAKWLFKLSGLYQAPFKVNVSAFYNTRQGYPFEAAVQLTNPIVLTATGQTVTTLPNGGGTPTIILDPIGENRLPNFQNLDLHFERPFSFGSQRVIPSVDFFNLTNNNTIQALRPNQNANNANQIQAIVAPRVIRFGVRVNW